MNFLRNVPLINREYGELNPVIFGEASYDKSNSFGPAQRDYYLMHYIVEGSGVYTTPGGDYKIKKGDIFIIRPGETTTYVGDDDNPWHYIWIGFTGKLAEKFDSLGYVLPFKSNLFVEMLDAFDLENMCEEYLTSKLFMLYYELFSAQKAKSHFAKKAKDYVDSYYMEGISVESISEALNINRRYLSRIFKRKYSITLGEYLIKIRMEKGLMFLQKGNSVAQAAKLTGYNDQFNFSKMFKKFYGISPSSVRKKDDNYIKI